MFSCSVFLLLVIITVGSKCCFALSPEANSVYNDLQKALINGNTSSVRNLDVLANAFFPKNAREPVCVPIKYTLPCNSSNTTLELDLLFQNHSFLWTANYISFSTGVLLLSYSKSGITLKGFEWERSCFFINETEIELEIDPFLCDSNILSDSLKTLTSQVHFSLNNSSHCRICLLKYGEGEVCSGYLYLHNGCMWVYVCM